MAHQAQPFPVQTRGEAPPATTILPLLAPAPEHRTFSLAQIPAQDALGWVGNPSPWGWRHKMAPEKQNKQPEVVRAGERKPWRSLAEENFPSDDGFLQVAEVF